MNCRSDININHTIKVNKWNDSLKLRPSSLTLNHSKNEEVKILLYENGSIHSILNYKNGRLHGEIWIFLDGQISERGIYENGLAEGEWITYNPEGMLDNIGHYKNGKMDGEWKFFDKNGDVKRIDLYKQDEFVKSITK